MAVSDGTLDKVGNDPVQTGSLFSVLPSIAIHGAGGPGHLARHSRRRRTCSRRSPSSRWRRRPHRRPRIRHHRRPSSRHRISNLSSNPCRFPIRAWFCRNRSRRHRNRRGVHAAGSAGDQSFPFNPDATRPVEPEPEDAVALEKVEEKPKPKEPEKKPEKPETRKKPEAKPKKGNQEGCRREGRGEQARANARSRAGRHRTRAADDGAGGTRPNRPRLRRRRTLRSAMHRCASPIRIMREPARSPIRSAHAGATRRARWWSMR